MRAFVAIFAREFRLRRVLLIGALAIGVLAPVIPRIQGLSGQTAAENGADAALLLGLITCGLFALVLGSGAIVRDLVDGRLGFDFAQPVSGFSIWAGRVGAAVALLFASAALVLAPALIVGWSEPSLAIKGDVFGLPAAFLGASGTFLAGWLACLVLLFLTHVFALFFASRSPALGLDFVGLVAAGFLAGAAVRRLYRNFAHDALAVGTVSYLAFFLAVLIGATLAQVLIGRTDLARGHRALSLALWVPLVLGGFAFDLASRWVIAPRMKDLVEAGAVFEAPAGPWFSVGGKVRNRGEMNGRFLIDSSTGRVVSQGVTWQAWFVSTAFSRDGRVAAWLTLSRNGTGVQWVDLAAAEPKVKDAPISFDRVAEVPSLSPTGRWFASRSNGRLLVFELRTGRLAASVPVNSDWSAVRTAWVGENRLRCWSVVANAPVPLPQSLSISEIQVPAEPGAAAAPVGSVALPAGGIAWGVSRDGATLLVKDNGTGRRRIFDGRTGEALGAIEAARQSGGVLLKNGLVAIVFRRPEPRSLAIYDRTGTLRRQFDLGGFQWLRLAGQPTPNTILGSASIGAAPAKGAKAEVRLLLFDLSAGTFREVGRGEIPPLDPSEAEARIVQTGPTAFARWDPATETLKPIVPR